MSVYGVVDTGFGVMKGKGQQTSVQAVSGGNAASRWGLTGKKKNSGVGITLSSSWNKASKVNNGAPQTAGVLFDRDSLLLVGGKWGRTWFRPLKTL